MRLARLVADTLFPPLCPVTGAETGSDGLLSPEAWREVTFLHAGPRCRTCGRPLPGVVPGPDLLCDLCTAEPRPWARGAAAMLYEGAGRQVVLSLKHRDRLDLVPVLAGWMRRAAPELVAEAELIVPVPLHRRRLLARRFNQAAELARALARQAGKAGACAPDLLRRVRATRSQGGLGREGRAANLAGALTAAPGARTRLEGRRVLLVDDVMTTGATLAAAARALEAAGAGRVDMLVAALVPMDGKPYVAADGDPLED
jgi:predicted amidophosphoribosyltransferase